MLCSLFFLIKKPVYLESQAASSAASAMGDMVIRLFIMFYLLL